MLAFDRLLVNPPPMLALLRLVSRLPLPLAHGLGALLGVPVFLFRRRLASDILANLRQAGLYAPTQALAAASGLGRGVMEMLLVWLRPLATVTGWVREVRGWEHVEAAHAHGKGLLILTPHLGCWELAGIYYGARLPMTALYRPPRQPWVHQIMKAGRERGRITTVPPGRPGVRALLAALKRNEAAFILPDQVANKGEGAWVPFFGRPVYMPILPYRLLQSTGATPLLFFGERLTWGRGYRLHILSLPPLPAEPEGAAAAVNAEIERLIRAHPAQYLWSYRIFRRHRGMAPPEEGAAT